MERLISCWKEKQGLINFVDWICCFLSKQIRTLCEIRRPEIYVNYKNNQTREIVIIFRERRLFCIGKMKKYEIKMPLF